VAPPAPRRPGPPTPTRARGATSAGQARERDRAACDEAPAASRDPPDQPSERQLRPSTPTHGQRPCRTHYPDRHRHCPPRPNASAGAMCVRAQATLGSRLLSRLPPGQPGRPSVRPAAAGLSEALRARPIVPPRLRCRCVESSATLRQFNQVTALRPSPRPWAKPAPTAPIIPKAVVTAFAPTRDPKSVRAAGKARGKRNRRAGKPGDRSREAGPEGCRCREATASKPFPLPMLGFLDASGGRSLPRGLRKRDFAREGGASGKTKRLKEKALFQRRALNRRLGASSNWQPAQTRRSLFFSRP